MTEALELLCSQSHARIDGTDSIPHGLRHSIVDDRGNVFYVSVYESGKVYVDGRGFATELIAKLVEWAGFSSRVTKAPNVQRSFTVPPNKLSQCLEKLATLGGVRDNEQRWTGLGWVATFYTETTRLTVQGKSTHAVVAELDAFLST